MSNTITEQDQIPLTPFYVVADDTFMPGWGPSEGKTNRVILPCESEEEARAVRRYARTRSDMADVRILRRPPLVPATGIHYSLMSRYRAQAWYFSGYSSIRDVTCNEVRLNAYRAARARLAGEIERAMEYEKEVERLIAYARECSFIQDAEDAERRGYEDGQNAE